MIRDAAAWHKWEMEGPLREPPDFARNLRLQEGMYELARSFGVFLPADPLEGLETDIRVARMLNSLPNQHVPPNERA